MLTTRCLQVIGMVKKKSVWYILVRAFREKMKGLRTRVVRAVESNHLDGLEKATADVKRSVRKMLRQKQEWLGFSERVKAAWEELGMRLCDWLVTQLRQYAPLSHLCGCVCGGACGP